MGCSYKGNIEKTRRAIQEDFQRYAQNNNSRVGSGREG